MKIYRAPEVTQDEYGNYNLTGDLAFASVPTDAFTARKRSGCTSGVYVVVTPGNTVTCATTTLHST
jgi:hypothetical protein